MTPPVQEAAIDEIVAALSQVNPENSNIYQSNATAYKDAISAKEEELNARLSQVNFSEVNVFCADQQMGFVSWTGLNVIDIFGRPESLTIQTLKDLVDMGRASG